LLIHRLSAGDERTCANIQAALAQLIEGWDTFDQRRDDLLGQLEKAIANASVSGQKTILDLATALLNSENSVDVLEKSLPSCNLLQDFRVLSHKEARRKALELSEILLKNLQNTEVRNSCRDLIRACLQDDEPENRLKAVQLGSRPPINLLSEIVPRLRDSNPNVRYAALLVLGIATEVLATDDLLPCLHDSNAQIRRLCQMALLGRGLRDEHIRLGRLLTEPDARKRLQVPDALRQTTDLEPGIWLRWLSHDPSPAVRAVAIRAAMETSNVEMKDRLSQMSQNDPSTTVRQLAKFYLSYHFPSVQ